MGSDMAIISVQKTEQYEDSILRLAVDNHFEVLGIARDLHPGMKVLLKPNLLSGQKPELAVTTHPKLMAAVIHWLRDHDITDITVADSPSGLYRVSNLRSVYQSTGMSSLSDFAKLNFDTGFQAKKTPDGSKNPSFNIIQPILDADYIINMPKLKTHGLATISVGVKNLFGAVPGLQKPELHFRYSEPEDFHAMLLELAQLVKPQLTLVDAVDTMEGNGPRNGTVRHLGLTFASRDVFTLDWYAAKLMGFEPESIPMIRQAVSHNLANPSELQVVGFDPGPAEPPYRLPDSLRKGGSKNFLFRILDVVSGRIVRVVPKVEQKKCIGCAKCAESCPMKIIDIRQKKAHISPKTCISCFCCQEMCPEDAITTRRVLKRRQK